MPELVMHGFYEWWQMNHLVNIDKTTCMEFTGPSRKQSEYEMPIQNITVNMCDDTKFLGKEMERTLEEMDKDEISRNLKHKAINFRFDCPFDPHMNLGETSKIYKAALKSILKERATKEEICHTCLIEAEHIVNTCSVKSWR
ncbi:hypothetical protein JTB14_008932 [Gonioctena quinquepunctata]|nr:hypothetical protein JTB14_008932 [Gonioctena quinquepunctata]